jgi:hypothetical protein
MRDNFSDLKPGDKLVVNRDYGLKEVGTVNKVGKFHITVSGRKYRIEGGWCAGPGTDFISRANAELLAEIDHRNAATLFARAVHEASNAALRKVFTVTEMYALIETIRLAGKCLVVENPAS